MSSFDLLAPPVKRWIASQNWKELRPIQIKAIEAILQSKSDIIVSAETAGGKTEAAFLPLITQILESENPTQRGFDVLYISPLKALINDQYRRLELLCRDTEIGLTPWHGDIASSIKRSAAKNPKGIVLITPESLEAMFLLRNQYIDSYFGKVKAVVIDELHTFLDSVRGVHLRSLLTRIEIATSKRARRIGLSATLGDMKLACKYLSREKESVKLINAGTDESELLVQLKGYYTDSADDFTAEKDIAKHLHENLRGANNLIFANARRSVEIFSDILREKSEIERVPLEFFPHHANISKGHREDVEKRLKADERPTSAICTSTLELGIDIGSVDCVAQVGAPFAVSSLRQRLGRSGRRVGQSSTLRQYVKEKSIDGKTNVFDKLRLGLFRSAAMIDLIVDQWCEPPKSQSLHLSTLVHQILSVIGQRNGASAKRLYYTLCKKGPFNTVTTDVFIEVLQHLGSTEVGLIEQGEDGSLLLGEKGELMVSHYSFYAVFKTPDEFRVVHQGRQLGTLPIDFVVSKGSTIIFVGKRWKILEIDSRGKVILVEPAPQALAPVFGGDGGEVHDRVVEEMRSLYLDSIVPAYFDKNARIMLKEGRDTFNQLKLDEKRIKEEDKGRTLIATWVGTVKTVTLGLAFGSFGYNWEARDGFLSLTTPDDKKKSIEEVLEFLKSGGAIDLSDDSIQLNFEKYHPYLSRNLLLTDALSSRIDLESLPKLAAQILEN